jgi:hypothetical protein
MADQDRYPPLGTELLNRLTKRVEGVWARWFFQVASPWVYRGTRADQGKVAPTLHSLYVVTDEGVLEQWDGTTWQRVMV